MSISVIISVDKDIIQIYDNEDIKLLSMDIVNVSLKAY